MSTAEQLNKGRMRQNDCNTKDEQCLSNGLAVV